LDEPLYSDLEFYKGDVEKDISSVALDKNLSGGGPLDDYQVVRSASSAVNGANQEITLDFTCPQGLVAYGTNGVAVNRLIEIDIEFSKSDEEVWRNFNELDYVTVQTLQAETAMYLKKSG